MWIHFKLFQSILLYIRHWQNRFFNIWHDDKLLEIRCITYQWYEPWFPSQTNQSHAADKDSVIPSKSQGIKIRPINFSVSLTIKVSLNEAKMWATPKTFSPSLTAGPNVTFSSLGSLVFLLDYTLPKNMP